LKNNIHLPPEVAEYESIILECSRCKKCGCIIVNNIIEKPCKWVSCEERLPTKNGNYWTRCKTEIIEFFKEYNYRDGFWYDDRGLVHVTDWLEDHTWDEK